MPTNTFDRELKINDEESKRRLFKIIDDNKINKRFLNSCPKLKNKKEEKCIKKLQKLLDKNDKRNML